MGVVAGPWAASRWLKGSRHVRTFLKTLTGCIVDSAPLLDELHGVYPQTCEYLQSHLNIPTSGTWGSSEQRLVNRGADLAKDLVSGSNPPVPTYLGVLVFTFQVRGAQKKGKRYLCVMDVM